MLLSYNENTFKRSATDKMILTRHKNSQSERLRDPTAASSHRLIGARAFTFYGINGYCVTN